MPPRFWPQNPVFKSEGEKELFEELLKTLSDHDAILTNVRFTDPQAGDIEIDLIALIADLGIVVIENKGGHVSFNGQSWSQSDSHGSRFIDPHAQVIKNLYSLRSELRSTWKSGNVRTDWLMAFPGSLIGHTHIPGVSRERILDRAEIGDAAQRCRKILEDSSHRMNPTDANWVNDAFDTIRGHSFLDSDREVSIYNNYHFVRTQTHERKSILSSLQENNRIYVKGPAGSGKTWLAFEQADMWATEGLKVGIVVFNRGLESYMMRKNSERKNKSKPEWVGTFHNLMIHLGTSAGSVAELVEKEAEFEATMMITILNLKDEQKFDAWVVDEAQDFPDSWWRVHRATLKNPESGKMAIFGDPKQRVSGRRGVPVGTFAVITLRENFRNSQQIAGAVQFFVRDQIALRGPQSYEVEFVEVESASDARGVADDVVMRLTDVELWDLGEIALLMTKHQHPIHKDKAEGDIDGYWSEFWENSDIFYGTVSGFKGLERSVVVLAVDGFHDEIEPDEILYIGMTRARDRLVVVSTREIFNSLTESRNPLKSVESN